MKKPINCFMINFQRWKYHNFHNFWYVGLEIVKQSLPCQRFFNGTKRRAGVPVVWEGCKMITSKQTLKRNAYLNIEIPLENQLRVYGSKFNISQLNIVLRGLTQEGEASDICLHEFLPKNFLKNLISTYHKGLSWKKGPNYCQHFNYKFQ
jgi:hypothetical protein